MCLLGYNITALMEERGIDWKQLATLSGIHHNTIYRYITGKSEPTFKKLIRIALVLDVSLDELTGYQLYRARKKELESRRIELLTQSQSGD